MARKQDQTSRKLANQLREHVIKPGIKLAWLKGMGNPQKVEVRKSRHQGATDAVIFEVAVELKLFLKFSYDAEKEIKGYRLLSQAQGYKGHLVSPLFSELDLANNVMLMPYQEAKELYELIREGGANKEYIKKLYKNFLETSKKLWVSTKLSSASYDFKEIYKKRIIDRLDRMRNELGISDIYTLKFVINGSNYGTFGEVWRKFISNIDTLNHVCPCTTHGDEHAKNILIYNGAVRLEDKEGWVIVDYVNAKKESDWIFSIAKMLHWWQFYYVLELAKSKNEVKKELNSSWKIQGKRLNLSYDANALEKHTPEICRVLGKEVMNFAKEVGEQFSENPANWQKRLKLALFSVIFGSMPLHFKEADFAIPIMIHKSFESLDNL